MIEFILAYVPDMELLTFDDALELAILLDRKAANELELSCLEAINEQ